MKHHPTGMGLALALVLTTACTGTVDATRRPVAPRASVVPMALGVSTAPGVPAVASPAVTGDVRGPAGFLISNNGGAVVSNNGGRLVSDNGGGLTGTSRWHTLALADVPYPHVEVFIADVGGQAVPTFKSVQTDSQGAFTIPGVPAGGLYLVVARFSATGGGQKVLQTLVRTTAEGAVAHLSAASSFVSAALVAGRKELPGDLDAATYERATRTTAAQLGEADVALLGDNAAMARRLDGIAAVVASLKEDVDKLQAQLARIEQGIAAINDKLDRALASPKPTPTPEPTPVPTATPSPAPSATPVPVATATPLPTSVKPVAGGATAGNADGEGDAASFANITGLAADGTGNMFVVDAPNHRLAEIFYAGMFLNAIGGARTVDTTADPNGKLVQPGALAVSPADVVYVADLKDATAGAPWVIRKVPVLANGQNFPLPTSAPLSGAITLITLKGPGLAGLGALSALAVSSSGTLYAADAKSNRLYTITQDGTVTVLAGGASATADGQGEAAGFSGPVAIALDSVGNLWVADSGSNAIRRVTPGGLVTTVAGPSAGGAMPAGYVDGPAATARFSNPVGLALDYKDRIFVNDRGNSRIRLIDTSRQVSTLAGDGKVGNLDGPGTEAEFDSASALANAFLSSGIYVAQPTRVRLVRFSTP